MKEQMKELFKKLFWMLMNERGEVNVSDDDANDDDDDSDENDKTMEDLISESIAEGEDKDDKKDDVSGENDKNKKGEDEKKNKEGDGESNQDDDPEVELDYEEDGKKAKMKMSEIKSTLKWLKENRQPIGGAMKVRELALANPEFGDLLNNVISKSIGEKGEVNKDFIAKTLKSFDVVADKIDDKIEDKDADIEEAEAMLDELDPESSQAMVLKKNIKIMKAQKSQLKEALGKIDSISSRLEGLDKKTNEDKQKVETQKYQATVEETKKIFNDEYESSTKENIEFINDSEKQKFQSEVKKLVAGQSAKIANNDDFKKVIRESVKIAKKNLEDYHEAIRTDYLKRKKKLPSENKKQEENPDPDKVMNLESLTAEVERQLVEGDGKG